jgi:sulfate transport system ATP-binding protein
MSFKVKNLYLEKSGFSLQVKTLETEHSSILTICGESGSGKTTFLNTLAGFEDIKKGRILLNGKELQLLSPQEREVGYIFQNLALFPGLTVNENLAYGIKAKRKASKREVEKEIDSLAEILGIKNLLKRFVETLSGGERQRVAIGRALAPKPKLLLLDEPFSALDAPLKSKLSLYLRWIQETWKIPMICVTHDQEDALRISDSIAFFKEGRLIEHQNTEDLIKRPREIETAAFFERNQILEFYWDKSVSLKRKAMVPPEAISLHKKEDILDDRPFKNEIFLRVNELRVQRISVGFKIFAFLEDGQEIWIFQKEDEFKDLKRDCDYLVKIDRNFLRVY